MKKNVKIPIRNIEVWENIRVETAEDELAELMQSIKQRGLLQNIKVWERKDGEFVLVYGYRRYLACKKLGYKEIEADIAQAGEMNEQDVLIENVMENLQRVNISPVELGRIASKLHDEQNLSIEEIAVRLGKPLGSITLAVELYQLVPKEMRHKVKNVTAGSTPQPGIVPATVAKRCIEAFGSYGESVVKNIMQAVIDNGLSVTDINKISSLRRGGLPLETAIKERDRLLKINISFYIDKEKAENLIEKHDMSIGEIGRRIIFGKLPPIKEYKVS